MADNIQLFNADDELENSTIQGLDVLIELDNIEINGIVGIDSVAVTYSLSFTYPDYEDEQPEEDPVPGAFYSIYGTMYTNENTPDTNYDGLDSGSQNTITLVASASYSIDCYEYTYVKIGEDYWTETAWYEEGEVPDEGWENTGESQISRTETEYCSVENEDELPPGNWKYEGEIIGDDGRTLKNYSRQVNIYEYKYIYYHQYDIYGWEMTNSYIVTGSGEISKNITVYTHPGTCDVWNDLNNSKRLKSAFIQRSEVEAWLIHYKKWKSWQTQTSCYEEDLSSHIPAIGEKISASWYNGLINLDNFNDVSTVNSGERIKASHFTALSNAIS